MFRCSNIPKHFHDSFIWKKHSRKCIHVNLTCIWSLILHLHTDYLHLHVNLTCWWYSPKLQQGKFSRVRYHIRLFVYDLNIYLSILVTWDNSFLVTCATEFKYVCILKNKFYKQRKNLMHATRTHRWEWEEF